MSTSDATLVLEFGQIAASGRLGDVELFTDLEDRDVSDFREKFGDRLAARFNCIRLPPGSIFRTIYIMSS